MGEKEVKKHLLKKIYHVFVSIALITAGSSSYFGTRVIKAYTIKAGNVTAGSLNIRASASANSAKIMSLARGSRVNIIDEVNTANGVWYKIQFSTGAGTKEGYASKTYIKVEGEENSNYKADVGFEARLNNEGFPESYKSSLRQLHAKYPNWIFKAQRTGIDWKEVIDNESLVGRNLVHKNSISSWKSTKAGAYNWDTGTWVGFDTNAWVAASEGIIRHYMDPRNFLDESYIFQFLDNAYSENGHDRSGLENMVKGSFLATGANIGNTGFNTGVSGSPNTGMGPGGSNQNSVNVSSGGPGTNLSGKTKLGNDVISTNPPTRAANSNVSLTAPGYSGNEAEIIYQASEGVMAAGPGLNSTTSASDKNLNTGQGGTYVDIIMRAGSISGVNPYVLAAMIIQEQGTNGASGLISGNTAPYQGYYNFFNIEAYQKGTQTPVQRGLWWASQNGSYGRPWNTREKAIIGGAAYYGDNYVKTNQNTLYLKKFNVLGTNRYKHQYMTNIEGAANEGVKLAKAYTESIKNSALEFSIPVYNNMPANPEPIPMGNDKPSNNTNNNTVNITDNNTTNNSSNLVGPGANLGNNKNKESNVSLVAP